MREVVEDGQRMARIDAHVSKLSSASRTMVVGTKTMALLNAGSNMFTPFIVSVSCGAPWSIV